MDWDVAPPGADDLRAALVAALTEARDLGLVEITEAGLRDWSHYDALLAARTAGGLPVRVRILVASGQADLDRMAATRDEADDDLAVIGVKFYADGWLGPRTCACSLPFADVDPDDMGILFLEADTLTKRADPYAAAGWTLATHAIGDRAIEAVLDAYEQVYGSADACRAAAPRVEHAQVLRPDLIERMAALGVVACIQPCFAHSDAEAAAAALADRFPDAYRWDRLLAAGVRVITGSDYPIEPLDPKLGFERLTTGPHPLDPAVALELVTR
jgi:predicted amidohydrolase YtcJ